MLRCEEAERLIVRHVDGVVDEQDRARLDEHLTLCAACRAERAAQEDLASLLRARAPVAPVDLAARIAERLDAEEEDGLAVVNWRVWTLGLAPVAAAVMLAAYLGIGSSTTTRQAAPDDWIAQASGSTSVLMQPGSTGDALVEAVLTGTETSGTENRNER